MDTKIMEAYIFVHVQNNKKVTVYPHEIKLILHHSCLLAVINLLETATWTQIIYEIIFTHKI